MTIEQWCRKCKQTVTAAMVLKYENGMQVSDKSTCPCGEVLWDWKLRGEYG
jgi:hypothetical protein